VDVVGRDDGCCSELACVEAEDQSQDGCQI
jgi:hypothetical protein